METSAEIHRFLDLRGSRENSGREARGTISVAYRCAGSAALPQLNTLRVMDVDYTEVARSCRTWMRRSRRCSVCDPPVATLECRYRGVPFGIAPRHHSTSPDLPSHERVMALDLPPSGPRSDRRSSFAVVGGAIATVVGGAIGVLFSMREFPGRPRTTSDGNCPDRGATCFLVDWRDTPDVRMGQRQRTFRRGRGGLALAPVTLLFVFAVSARFRPICTSGSSRLSASDSTGVVLLPLCASSLLGGFVLTVILLLGESEMPFLFGFRTGMTDIVTAFAQTFDVRQTVPHVVPLLLVMLICAGVAGRLLWPVLFASSRGAHGGFARAALCGSLLWAGVPPTACVAMAMTGYAWALFAAPFIGWSRLMIDPSAIAPSVLEPVGCAWMAMTLTLVAAYRHADRRRCTCACGPASSSSVFPRPSTPSAGLRSVRHTAASRFLPLSRIPRAPSRCAPWDSRSATHGCRRRWTTLLHSSLCRRFGKPFSSCCP